MTRYLKFRDTAGRQWEIKGLSREAHRSLVAKRTSGAHFRTGACIIRFAEDHADLRAEIVSLGLGYVEEEDRGDGSIRTTRVPPAGEVVGTIDDARILRDLHGEMLRGEGRRDGEPSE